MTHERFRVSLRDMSSRYPFFARGDLDGFFGLFIDNLVQLLLIVFLCGLCGIAPDSPLMVDAILPGVAVSVLFGNLFYAWQARQLARQDDRSDVTALPYGINTTSLIVFVIFVMKPVYDQTGSPHAAWQMGLLACLGSGVIELAGSLVAEQVRRHTPRAALLSTLAGIALAFISMMFLLQIFTRPLVAMLPLAVILVTYFSKTRFPGGLPGGLVAVLLGTASAWCLTGLSALWTTAPSWIVAETMQVEELQLQVQELQQAVSTGVILHVPSLYLGVLETLIHHPESWTVHLSVIIPMGLFNVLGSLQNIESAEAAGDRYGAASSLAVNGLGTIAAAACGSCFPTTIYIGHPGWKGLGARAGYSTLNGLVITLICLTGTVGLIGRLIPIEAGVAIVVWIGVVITAQAFQATPPRHAPAVALGLFPAIAAWGTTLLVGAGGAFSISGGRTLQELISGPSLVTVGGFGIHGLLVMERGYLITCMVLSAVAVSLLERRFRTAAAWSLLAAGATVGGLVHAYQVSGNTVDSLFAGGDPQPSAAAYRGLGIAIGYAMMAVGFLVLGRRRT